MNQAEVIQALVSGLALGANYALLAVGIVTVYAATGVLNFAQGAFMLVGAYLTFQLGSVWGFAFPLAVLVAMAVGALLSVLTGTVLMRRFGKHEHFAAVMATVGLLFVGQALVAGVWGDDARNLGDPWGLATVTFGGAVLPVAKLWTIVAASILLGAVFLLMSSTKLGLGMRAVVADEEAAMAQGISARSVSLLAWGLGGGMGALAGVLLATGASGVNSTLGVAAFAALPAMVLGGMDSPLGALVGGLLMGMAQQFALVLQPTVLEPLGGAFPSVLPYFILLAVLLIRPQGIFGSTAVRRF